MSSSFTAAQQLMKVQLELGGSDINFLRPFLSSLSHSQSLQELFVLCDASGVFSVCAAHTCMHSHMHTHTTCLNILHHHIPTRQVRRYSFNQQTPPTHATVFLYACTTRKTQAYMYTHAQTRYSYCTHLLPYHQHTCIITCTWTHRHV